MSDTLSMADVHKAVAATVDEVIGEYKDQPDAGRETLIERLDEECDTLWGQLVYQGRIDQWDADTLANHAGECAAIIQAAKRDAWVEDDEGLWQGLTYGVVASIAYFSLRNLLYQALVVAGVDSNNDLPFAAEEEPCE
jgi:hypothetical protein